MARNVLLNLDTLVVRPKISIDGKTYEILSPDELPVLTSHMLAMKGRRMDELGKQSELSPEEEDELTRAVDDIAYTIMAPVPATVRDKLSGAQRVAVIEAFTGLLLSKKAGTAAATLAKLLAAAVPSPAGKSKATGAKRPRGSSGSTAGRRDGGSPKRRSRS